MEKLAKNKIVLAVVVVIVGVGLIAAYIPLLFIPSSYEEQPPTENQNAQPIAEATSTPRSATSTPTSTSASSKKSPDPFSGIGEEQKSLNDLGNLLNQ